MSSSSKSKVPQVDISRWVVLYPAYINSNRTIQEGRRIAKEKGTPDPVIQELLEAAKKIQLPVAVEDKSYSRYFLDRGRLKLKMKQEDGKLTNPTYARRKDIYEAIAKLVRESNGQWRPKRPAAKQVVDAGKGGGAASNKGSTSKASGGSSKSNKKKKGKK